MVGASAGSRLSTSRARAIAELEASLDLYWPDLDVDLAVESIEHPERFPLVSKVQSNFRLPRAPARGRR